MPCFTNQSRLEWILVLAIKAFTTSLGTVTPPLLRLKPSMKFYAPPLLLREMVGDVLPLGWGHLGRFLHYQEVFF